MPRRLVTPIKNFTAYLTILFLLAISPQTITIAQEGLRVSPPHAIWVNPNEGFATNFSESNINSAMLIESDQYFERVARELNTVIHQQTLEAQATVDRINKELGL